MAYKELLEFAKKYSNMIKLHGGFIPRTYAKILMRESEEAALKAAKELDYVPSDVTSLEGTDLHYNMFESMISQRNMYDKNLQPNDGYKKLFKAQLIKDYAMAHKVNKLVKTVSSDSKLLVITGKGHTMHYCGVPERVLKENPVLMSHTTTIVA